MLFSEKACEEFDEIEIIKRSLKNVDFFACIYLRYEGKLLQYIKRITNASDIQAEDILQDAFIKIWKNLNGFDRGLKFSSWVYRIVHNEAISHWRKNRGVYPLLEHNLIEHEIIDQMDQDIAFNLENELKEKKVISTLHALPEKYKEILILRFFENLSYEEISDILKIPEGTVATRINRAKKELRRKWKRH